MKFSKAVALASEAIDFCKSEHSRLSGTHLDQEIDGAAVQHSSDNFTIVFTHGPIPMSEGEASSEFRPILTCMVRNNQGFELMTLGDSEITAKPLYQSADFELFYSDFYDSTIQEMIFLRQGDQFVFKEIPKKELDSFSD